MKKNLRYMLVLSLLVFMPLSTLAVVNLPGAPKCWTVPAVWTGDQEVTFYYDVTDVGFAPGVDLYLWAWQPTEPDAGNGNNSSDFAKLTYDGNNIYHITMIPVDYFHTTVDAFENMDWAGMWQQLKTKDDAMWTASFAAPDNRLEWSNFASSGSSFQVFSGKKTPGYTAAFTIDQPLAIVIDPDLFQVGGMSMTEYEKVAGFNSFNMNSGLNDFTFLQGVKAWVPAAQEKTHITKLSNGYYSFSMSSPYDYYSWNYNDDGTTAQTGLEVDTQIENLAWIVVGVKDGVYDQVSAATTTKAGTATPYPDPLFTTFPTRVSATDILTLIRQWNESTAGELTYTIEAGSKTITGTMDGTRDKRQGTIDLISELSGLSVKDLHITVVTSSGHEVVNTTIPLITPDADTNN